MERNKVENRLGKSKTLEKGKQDLLAKSGSHLVGESACDDHTVRLARAGPENDAEAIEIVAGSAGVHHFDGAAGEAEGHGPDGAAAGPVHEIVDLGDDELRRLGDADGRGSGGRRWRSIWCGCGCGCAENWERCVEGKCPLIGV